jgi:hypothetical protein
MSRTVVLLCSTVVSRSKTTIAPHRIGHTAAVKLMITRQIEF